MKHAGKIVSWLLILGLFVVGLGSSVEASAESMIPVVTIEADSLENWQGKSDVRDAVLTYRDFASGISFRRDIWIKPQGTSSLAYDKKNFTIGMKYEAVELNPNWGEQAEYCLKANYIDPTQAGNVVSAKLAAQMNAAYGLYEETPNHGLIDGFPVWVILNGKDAGLYTWNIPKAAWMFGMDEDNENHIVMCCEGYGDSCLFKSDNYVLEDDWDVEVGKNDSQTVEKFVRLLRFVSTSSDEVFKADFDQYLNLDACLNYYCFITVAFGADNIAKNMLMATWDGQVWYPMLYDLDSLWGINYDGLGTVGYDAEVIVYNISYLFERIRELYGDELRARYAELRDGVLSVDNIKAEFNEFVSSIPETSYAMDRALWNEDGHLVRTLDLMWEMIDQYLPEVDAAFGYGDAEPTENLAGQVIGDAQEEDDAVQEGDAQN